MKTKAVILATILLSITMCNDSPYDFKRDRHGRGLQNDNANVRQDVKNQGNAAVKQQNNKTTNFDDFNTNGFAGFDIADINELFSRMDKLKGIPSLIDDIKADVLNFDENANTTPADMKNINVANVDKRKPNIVKVADVPKEDDKLRKVVNPINAIKVNAEPKQEKNNFDGKRVKMDVDRERVKADMSKDTDVRIILRNANNQNNDNADDKRRTEKQMNYFKKRSDRDDWVSRKADKPVPLVKTTNSKEDAAKKQKDDAIIRNFNVLIMRLKAEGKTKDVEAEDRVLVKDFNKYADHKLVKDFNDKLADQKTIDELNKMPKIKAAPKKQEHRRKRYHYDFDESD